MRHLIYGIRVILQLSGFMLGVTSWLVRHRGTTLANAMLIAGIFFYLAGLLVQRATRLKRCPRCAEKINSELRRCSLCGFDFPATPVESIFRPFYK
jgi:predicted transporter